MDQDFEVQPESNIPYFSNQLKRGLKSPARQPCYSSTFVRDSNIDSASASTEPCVSCTTFNILAPIYKRMNGEDCRESQFPEFWLSRNEGILELLCGRNSSILCLQEVWLGSDELVMLYEQRLGSLGYEMYQLARTNNRGDGIASSSSWLQHLQYMSFGGHPYTSQVWSWNPLVLVGRHNFLAPLLDV